MYSFSYFFLILEWGLYWLCMVEWVYVHTGMCTYTGTMSACTRGSRAALHETFTLFTGTDSLTGT